MVDFIQPDFLKEIREKHRKTTKQIAWYDRVYQDGDCITCTNKTNPDGYMRVSFGLNKSKTGPNLRMAHVLVWESVNGLVPEGMEINHKCGNRRCFNPNHLELLDGSHHTTHTNVNRVGYVMNRASNEEVSGYYYQVKYNGVAINEIVRQTGMKRSTLSSIMNKRSRTKVTDVVDNYVKAVATFM